MPKPSDKARKPIFEQLVPTNPMQRHHPGRLIINIHPKITKAALPSASSVVQQINHLLRSDTHNEPTPANLTVQGMLMSHSANPIIITGERCTAEDLKPWYDEICAIFTKNAYSGTDIEIDRTAEATPDYQRYQVRLSQVPRLDLYGATITPDHLADLIQEAVGDQTELVFASEPRYLVRPDPEWNSNLATVVVPLRSANHAALLLERKTLFIAGERCYITRFEDRPRPTYCDRCSSLGHRENSRACPGTLCATCTDPDHTTSEHPVDISEQCINCGGDHASRSHTCPIRHQKPITNTNPPTQKSEVPTGPKAPKKRAPKSQHTDKEGFTTIGEKRHLVSEKEKHSAYANAAGLGQPFSSAPPSARATCNTRTPGRTPAAAPTAGQAQMEVDPDVNTTAESPYA